MQNPLLDAEPAHAADLEAFRHHGISYSSGLVSVTAVPDLIEPFDPLNELDTEGRLMGLPDDWKGEIENKHHCLKVLRHFHQSTDMGVQSLSDQVNVR